MPFARPGITTLRSQAISDIQTGLGVPTLLRRSPLRVLGYAQAGLAYHQYGYLDWISRQSVPFTATDEYLEAWAGLVGILRQPATFAVGQVSLTALAGTLVPAGSAFRRGDGFTFFSGQDVTVPAAGTAAVPVVASVAGAAGNTDVGVLLVLAAPIAGAQPGAPALTPIVGGADQESTASLRTRMLTRWRRPPQGGDLDDYVEWALDVPGVSRAWSLGGSFGPGTVVVWVMFDDAEAANGGFPLGSDGVAAAEKRGAAASGDQLTVANALYPLRPATAEVHVCSPVALPVPFSIKAVSTVPATVQAAVQAAIVATFRRLASPLGGAAAALPTSPFETAIAAVPGMPYFSLLAPAAPIAPSVGQLPVSGVVEYA